MPTTPSAAAAPQGLFARFLGVITAPKATFEGVVAHPRWLGMLVLTTAIVTVLIVLPMTTPDGQQAVIDQNIDRMESFGAEVSDEMIAGMERTSSTTPWWTAVSMLVLSPIMALVSAGILFGVFTVTMGGMATFKQVFAVIVHAGVITVLAQVFTAPLNYLQGSVSSKTNLAVLLPMVPEGTFAGRLLGMIDIFLVWYVIVLAIGLAVTYRQRTQPIAMTLFGIYALIALVLATVMSALGR